MPTENTPIEDPWAIAVHEAGHFFVGTILGRKILRITTVIEEIDGKKLRGCHWKPISSEHDWNEFIEISILLAGPLAQLKIVPNSLQIKQRALFREKFIQEIDSDRKVPKIYYDLGWQHDAAFIYQKILYPHFSITKKYGSVEIEKIVEDSEKAIRKFMSDSINQDYIIQFGKHLAGKSVLENSDITELCSKLRIDEYLANNSQIKEPEYD